MNINDNPQLKEVLDKIQVAIKDLKPPMKPIIELLLEDMLNGSLMMFDISCGNKVRLHGDNVEIEVIVDYYRIQEKYAEIREKNLQDNFPQSYNIPEVQ